MVICPIALAVHCTGCPFVKFCPAKTIIGDYKELAPKQKEEDGHSGTSSDQGDTTPMTKPDGPQ